MAGTVPGARSIGALFADTGIRRAITRQNPRFERLAAGWLEVTGAACRSHTTDLILKDGILRVIVNGKAWEQELRLQDLGALAGRMAAATGLTVAKIKVRTGATGGSTHA
ncbi:MAG: DciA family protein [Planctomycetota bacterium]